MRMHTGDATGRRCAANAMTTFRKLAIAVALGPVGYLLYLLLRCRHSGEMWDRLEDGTPVLRCRQCFRTRPNIMWGGRA